MSDKKNWISEEELQKLKNELRQNNIPVNDAIDDILKNSFSDEVEIDKDLLSDLLGGEESEPAPPVYAEKEEEEGFSKQPVEVRGVSLEEFSEDGEAEIGVPGLQSLFNIPIDIRVVLGSTEKTIEEILDLKIDSIMKLSKLAGEPVEVIAGSQIVARGETVIIDDRFGVLITEIIPPKERIQSVKGNLKTLKTE